MTIRDRWEALSDRKREAIIYVWPLVLSGLLVAADWVWRHSEGVATPATSRRLLTRVGVALTLWVVIKIAFTRRWSFDGIGAVLVLAGVVGVFVRVGAGRGPQPVSEAERDLIQSALDVGAAILLLGLPAWLLVKWRQHRRDKQPWDGSERRIEPRRRWPDRRQDE